MASLSVRKFVKKLGLLESARSIKKGFLTSRSHLRPARRTRSSPFTRASVGVWKTIWLKWAITWSSEFFAVSPCGTRKSSPGRWEFKG